MTCQDLSVAGKRAGLAGKRSWLFHEMVRITDELQPALVVWENVPGLFSSNSGRDFLAVLTALDGIGYHGAWRTLDAQYFGVAQRRRRVFGVFARDDIGASCCAEILSLKQGLRGHPAPRRETGQGVAGTLGGSSQSGGFRTTDLDNNGALICGAVSSKWAKGTGGPAGDECQNLIGFNSLGPSGFKPVIAFDPGQSSNKKATEQISVDHSPPLISARVNAVCFKPAHYSRGTGGAPAEVVPTLTANADKGDQEAVVLAFSNRTRDGVKTPEVMAGGIAPALTNPGEGGRSDAVNVATGSCVRRLTPTECERLMGFPDDWTAGFADSTRYRMLGNAVVVPVAEWIGKRIVKVMSERRDPCSGR